MLAISVNGVAQTIKYRNGNVAAMTDDIPQIIVKILSYTVFYSRLYF